MDGELLHVHAKQGRSYGGQENKEEKKNERSIATSTRKPTPGDQGPSFVNSQVSSTQEQKQAKSSFI